MINVHNGQFAVNVKNPEDNDTSELVNLLYNLKDADAYIEDIMNWMQKWSAENIANIERKLRKQYPSFDIDVNWTGRSGGWIEITGIWKSEDLLEDVSKHHQNIIKQYILPRFDNMVSNLLKNWNKEYQTFLRNDICVLMRNELIDIRDGENNL